MVLTPLLNMLLDLPDPDTFAIRMQENYNGSDRLEEKSVRVQSPTAGLAAGARLPPARAHRPLAYP